MAKTYRVGAARAITLRLRKATLKRGRKVAENCATLRTNRMSAAQGDGAEAIKAPHGRGGFETLCGLKETKDTDVRRESVSFVALAMRK
ncbi:MAG: hypothetical protein U0S50_08005 [Sphingopyxis sp.]|uniref:hypothetical protein n=1 Tax=Sphingopyxis sp. TaxID=1908224 RepID=UPI002AB9A0F1|nr:hypothetical protein [Sphingopyxis sp.]MDZ3831744.1 hypothetical protein [Sphingopyxis sp.]